MTLEQVVASLAQEAIDLRTMLRVKPLHAPRLQQLLGLSTAAELANMYPQLVVYGCFAIRYATGKKLRIDTLQHTIPRFATAVRELFQEMLDIAKDTPLASQLQVVIAKINRLTLPENVATDIDPVVHLYELFLAAYDPQQRRQRGVYYTPLAVINFMLQAVDRELNERFGLQDGLAAQETWEELAPQGVVVPANVCPQSIFVRILEPAMGTGGFLLALVRFVHQKMVEKWQLSGMGSDDIQQCWIDYVSHQLLPRMYACEVMAVPFFIGQLQLSIVLVRSGYPIDGEGVLQLSLTDALRDEHVSGVTVVLGNPPYQGHSQNQTAWSDRLIHAYRYIDGQRLRLSQSKWLHNDYIKFIAVAEELIARSGLGVLSLVTDHSYLDGENFVGVRYHLRQTFDRISVLNLHGNHKRKEHPPAGKENHNVFDIVQGVAIMTASRSTEASSSRGLLCYQDLWGTRDEKQAYLQQAVGQKAMHRYPYDSLAKKALFAVQQQDTPIRQEYQSFDSLAHIFAGNGRPRSGFLSTHDRFAIAFSEQELEHNIDTVVNSSSEAGARQHLTLCRQSQWSYEKAKKELASGAWKKLVKRCLYRPFDVRFTAYDRNILVHRRHAVSKHLLQPGNMALLTTRMTKGDVFQHLFVSDFIVDTACLSSKTSTNAYVFPLYLRHEGRLISNISAHLLSCYQQRLGLAIRPQDIFYYCYAVLSSPKYRQRYGEFLQASFPRVARPSDRFIFQQACLYGKQLVEVQLLQSLEIRGTKIFVGDDSCVRTIRWHKDTIWINPSSGFHPVPQSLWNCQIGGYYVLRKWLSYRKGRSLLAAEIDYFSTVIAACDAQQSILQQLNAMEYFWLA